MSENEFFFDSKRNRPALTESQAQCAEQMDFFYKSWSLNDRHYINFIAKGLKSKLLTAPFAKKKTASRLARALNDASREMGRPFVYPDGWTKETVKRLQKIASDTTLADHDLAVAITNAEKSLTIDLEEVDARSEAKAEVDSLRALCENTAAVDRAVSVLRCCPDEAFRHRGLFNAARTDEDEIVLDWDDDNGPTITLFVASSDEVVFVCDWTDGEESGTLPDEPQQRDPLLQAMFERLNLESG